ncbi:ABC transporter permease subunit [Mycoplasmopsis alligatoris]|uniref:ABC transporter, permease protein n=1 Tax=Mycoplasmopsis alligatoris A21JP2 TaxID=747682 RepID=D4XWN8_9BACT|nr:ABC transporter permease subunit [Mycoplasmopsis alligatoris]EFF41124.1 ABC transporter, permease protein [Mycoplasmopsis alligatoris A21JP2]
MENLKLYNWYDTEFETILPEQSKSIKSFKRQAQNTFDRRIDAIKTRKNVEKDLFLRARTKLEDTKKRELSSNKVAYKNRIKVLEESIKQLNFSNSINSLISFEINKIKTQRKELYAYIKDFEKSLKNTGDSLEFKTNSLKNALEKSKKEEVLILEKFAIYNIVKNYINSYSDLDFDLAKLSSKLSSFENEFIKSQPNLSNKLKEFYSSLESKRQLFVEKKKDLEKKYSLTIKKQKELFARQQSNIKLEFDKKILELEFEYNQKYQQNLEQAKETKKLMLEKIDSQKEIILNKEKLNNQKIEQIISSAKSKEAAINKYYKKVNSHLFKFAKLDLTLDYFLFLNSISNYKNDTFTLDIAKKRNNLINSKNFLIDLNNLFEEIHQNCKEIEKTLLTKNIFDQKALNKVKKVFYSFENKISYIKIAKSLFTAKKSFDLSGVQKKYTYEAKFNNDKYEALLEKSFELKNTVNLFNKEKAEAILELINLEKNNRYAEEKLLFENKKKEVNTVFFSGKKELKDKLRNSEITKQAYQNKLNELKIEKKEAIYSEKLNSEIKKNKEILKTVFFRKSSAKKVVNKIAESKISESLKTHPIEMNKNVRWLAVVLGFLLPGLSEILFFKQYTKGFLMLAFTIFAYAAIIPFAFGAYWEKMGGIPGFSDLGKGKFNSSLGIFTDARYYLFGGVISVILFVLVIIYFTTSAISANRVARNLERGCRPSKWSHTKRWLNTSGFPWLISIPGWMLMIFIVIAPVVTSVLISFTNYGFMHEAPGRTVDWVGLEQWGKWWIFRELNLALSIQRVLVWTIIWTFASATLPIIVGFAVAILVNNHRIKGKKIFRLIYIVPWAIPAFVTILFLKSGFQSDEGSLFNLILLKLGFISKPIDWWASVNIIKTLLIIIQTWIGHAWIFMLVTGNLQSIPKDIYEAGSIDGARGWKLFKYLTIPSLLAAIAPMLIGQFVGAFNNFTIIALFSGGGPSYQTPTVFGEGTTDIVISWVYKLASGAIKVEGDQAFAAALTTIAAGLSIAVASRGFIRAMSRRD